MVRFCMNTRLPHKKCDITKVSDRPHKFVRITNLWDHNFVRITILWDHKIVRRQSQNCEENTFDNICVPKISQNVQSKQLPYLFISKKAQDTDMAWL